MQVVGQGDVDDVDLAGGQQFTIVARFEAHGGDAVEPCQDWLAEVGYGGEDWGDADFLEGAPAGKGAGHFAAHQAASDDADFNRCLSHGIGRGEMAEGGSGCNRCLVSSSRVAGRPGETAMRARRNVPGVIRG